MRKRGYKTELDLNNEQITACKKHAGCARKAYNWGLARKQEARGKGEPMPDARTLHRELNALKAFETSIQLPRLGTLRLKEKLYLPRNAKIGSATITEQAGRWYVSICVHEELAEPEPATGPIIGVDLGVKTLATAGLVAKNKPSNQRPAVIVIEDLNVSGCGWRHPNLTLADRVFMCQECGLTIGRDLNAAQNLAALARTVAYRELHGN